MDVLTGIDVERLRSEPSPANRAATAEKVAAIFSAGRLGEEERAIATAIFTVLARDAEVVVRRCLAQALQSAPDLPLQVARTLAFDVAEVANPILLHSMALTDGDLVAVVARCSLEHSLAIAQRRYLSAEVTGTLIARKDEGVVAAILANENAQIDEPGYHLLVDGFGRVPRIMDMMSLRAALPFSIVERIVTLVADSVRERLASQYGLTGSHVAHLVGHGREQVLLATIGEDADPEEIDELVRALLRVDQLTPTLVLRALCLGEFVFAASALAHMARIQFTGAWQLLLDQGLRGADQLYDRCRLPVRMKPIYLEVLALARRYQFVGDPRLRGPFRSRVHEWGATALGVPQNTIGFEQTITKLFLTAGGGAAEPPAAAGRSEHRAVH